MRPYEIDERGNRFNVGSVPVYNVRVALREE
jgi:hypothetical protein